MSPTLNQLDRMLWAVERRAAGVILLPWRHPAVAQHLPVTLLVLTEQGGGEVGASSIALAEAGVDLHFHQDIPFR
jgi:hypothetical protein